MATLQVKGMDDHLYETLRRQAELDHRSISQEVVSMIERFLAQPVQRREGNAADEFLALAGTWEDERDAQTIVKDIRSARNSVRRFKRESF